MKKLLALLLFALPCMGQNPLFITSSFNTATAATPTFSPVAGAVSNPTTVTASSATIGQTGCTMYLDASNPPTTAQSTYSVTVGVTLYAQVRGCVAYNNSAVASAAYTISVLPVIIQTVQCSSSPCTISSTGAGHMLIYYGSTGVSTSGRIVAISANVSGNFTQIPGCNVTSTGNLYSDAWAITNITGGDTSVTFNPSALDTSQAVLQEVSHANTVLNGGCLTNLQNTASTSQISASFASLGNNFIAVTAHPSASVCGTTPGSGTLPSTGAWTRQNPGAGGNYNWTAISSTSGTYQFICTSSSSTSNPILAAFAN